MTAGSEHEAAGGRGHLRSSRSEREQAVDILKAAFIQGRLTKAELDERVGQVLESRTYAQLGALTADIPDGVTAIPLPAVHSRGPGRALSFQAAARVGAVGAIPSMASAAVVMVNATGVPVVLGIMAVGMTGVIVAVMLTALLIALSWAVRRRQPDRAGRPPSAPGGPAARRQAPARPLPPAQGPDRWRLAEASTCRLPRPQAGLA